MLHPTTSLSININHHTIITYVRPSGVDRRPLDVREQVVLEADELHEQHAPERPERRLLEDLRVVERGAFFLGGEAELGARAGDEVLVALDGVGCVLERCYRMSE